MKKEITINILRDEVVIKEEDGSEQMVPLGNPDWKSLTRDEIIHFVKNKLEGSVYISGDIEDYNTDVVQ